jgi:hypothetical protein
VAVIKFTMNHARNGDTLVSFRSITSPLFGLLLWDNGLKFVDESGFNLAVTCLNGRAQGSGSSVRCRRTTGRMSPY